VQGSCVLEGESQAAIYESRDSVLTFESNYIHPDYSASVCAEAGMRMAKELPGAGCFVGDGSECDFECVSFFDKDSCEEALATIGTPNDLDSNITTTDTEDPTDALENDNTLTQVVTEFYISYDVPELLPGDATGSAYESLRLATMDYINQSLATSYSEIAEVAFAGFEMSVVQTKFGANIPNERFDVYMHCTSTSLFDSNLQTPEVPDSDEIFYKLQESITVDYILGCARSITEFASTVEVILGAFDPYALNATENQDALDSPTPFPSEMYYGDNETNAGPDLSSSVVSTEFYIAFDIPDLHQDISSEDYDALRSATTSFFNETLATIFAEHYDVSFSGFDLLISATYFGIGVPADRFNLYIEFISTSFFNSDSSVPGSEELFSLLKGTISAEYILEFVRPIPALGSNMEVVFRAIEPLNLPDNIFENSNTTTSNPPGESFQNDNSTIDNSTLVDPPVEDFETNKTTLAVPVEFSASFDVPGMLNDTTAEVYDALRLATLEYFNEKLNETYANKADVVFLELADLSIESTQFDAGVPEDRFNVYVEFSAIGLFKEGAPTEDLLLRDIRATISVEFILEYVRKIPGFESTLEVAVRPIDRLPEQQTSEPLFDYNTTATNSTETNATNTDEQNNATAPTGEGDFNATSIETNSTASTETNATNTDEQNNTTATSANTGEGDFNATSTETNATNTEEKNNNSVETYEPLAGEGNNSTSTNDLLPPPANTSYIPVVFFVAFVVTDMPFEPTATIYDEALNGTHAFLSKKLNDLASDDENFPFFQLDLAIAVSGFEIGVPSDRFNVYIEFESRSLFNFGPNSPCPQSEQYFKILQDSMSTDYVTEYIWSIPGFNTTTEAVLRKVDLPTPTFFDCVVLVEDDDNDDSGSYDNTTLTNSTASMMGNNGTHPNVSYPHTVPLEDWNIPDIPMTDTVGVPVDFSMSFVFEGGDQEPTWEEFEGLRLASIDFLNGVLTEAYELIPTVDFLGLDIARANVTNGSGNTGNRFNLFIEYNSTVYFKAGRQTPDYETILVTIRESMSSDFIQNYVWAVGGAFGVTSEVALRRIEEPKDLDNNENNNTIESGDEQPDTAGSTESGDEQPDTAGLGSNEANETEPMESEEEDPEGNSGRGGNIVSGSTTLQVLLALLGAVCTALLL